MENNLARNIKSIFDERYVIPLYQRNFTWGKDEIEQLFQDIYDSFNTNENRRYYLGTLVVIPRRNEHVFEVIDGQQRLTVLSLISKLLGIVDIPVLKYDSRPEVEEFLRDFYTIKKTDIDNLDKDLNAYFRDIPQTENLRTALSYIRKVEVFKKKEDKSEKDGKSEEKIALFELSDELEGFKKYFSEKVILIFEEMPDDTDVAAYFEIMNNRGEQLQKHEILKAKFISQIDENNSLKDRKRELFAAIWDACSKMNVPVQRFFSSEARKSLFGKDFDGVNNNWECLLNDNYVIKNVSGKNVDDDDDDSEFGSIIDFPNFLMHVLKIYGVKSQNGNDISIPLNEKNMPTDGKVDDPIKFAKALLYFRVVFDRFIVKTSSKESDDPNWVLYSTYKQVYKDKDNKEKTSLRVDRATFGVSYRNIFNDSETTSIENEDLQDRIIKALSMLQVTFRQRINKNWLQELLQWFWNKYQIEENNGFINLNLISATDYLYKIDEYIMSYFNQNIKKNVFDVSNSWIFNIEKGEKTPHFLFNFIDYLYWVDLIFKKQEREISKGITINADSKFGSNSGSDENNGKQVVYSDFSFKYYNSVEHHYPQHPENENNIIASESLENLGNLYLISKSINSKMSNQLPVAKMEYKAENPNRRIMYYLTAQKGWKKEVIQEHYNDLVKLLQECDSILGIVNDTNKTV